MTPRLAAALFLVAALLPGLSLGPALRAAERVAHGGEDPARWKRLGSLRGSASSLLAQEAADWLFGVEQDGDLYDDLGNLTLGLGASPGDFKVKWDNSFSRAVEPVHERLPPGSTLTATDLSRYVDIQGTISRWRLEFKVPTDLTGDFGVGIRAERGWSLTVARARQPLVFGERPLQEVLAERKADDFRELVQFPPLGERDLLELTAGGVAAVARKIAHGVSPTADTEVGKIFFDNAANPITLFFEIGIPIPAEMFTAADSRLSEGDRIRQITFIGASPVAGGISEFGLQFFYENFGRLLRETTIVKEPDNRVLVSVRHVLLKGHSLKPLKIRPEVRLLGIVTLGYTLFEQRMTRGSTASAGLVYRIDLNTPAGLEALKALLGEGTDVRSRPLRVAAERGEGAELLSEEQRRGRRRERSLRIRIFSPFRFGDRKTVYSDRVKVGEVEFQEMGVARLRDLRKRIGRDRDWRKQFLISSQGNLRMEDQETAGAVGDGAFAVNLLSGFRAKRTDRAEVRRQVTLLKHSLGPHPVFDLLSSQDDAERTDYFGSLRISLGADHLLYFERVTEREVWVELAEILLGSAHADAWATPEARKLWKRRKHRRLYGELIGEELASLAQPTKKRLGLKDRYRLSRRAVAKFARLQELIRTGDCLPCLSAVFDKERDVVLLQMLLIRLAVESGESEPGYLLEIFGEPMLSPVTLTNGVAYDFTTAGRRLDEVVGETLAHDRETGPEQAARRISESQSILGGARNLVRGSDDRLRAADLFLNVDPEAPEGSPIWKLRLFSDLRFSPELALRIDLRESKLVTADPVREVWLVPFGEPTGVLETPFAAARLFYDLALPAAAGLEGGEGYTLLLRALNPDGRPVSEEQQLRFRWPKADELPASLAERAQP